MFIKTSNFKKLLKEAYKGGRLHLGRIGENTLMIHTGYTVLNIEIDKMLPAEKAAVVEFSGELPQEGESWLCTDGGNQIEVFKNEWSDLTRTWEHASRDWKITYVKVATPSGDVRAVQNTKTNDIMWYQESFLQQVVLKPTREDELFDGKLIMFGSNVMFHDDFMTYMVAPFDLNNADLDALLGNMEVAKQWWTKPR